MTKDSRKSVLNIPNSYLSPSKAQIDLYLAKAISLFNKKGYKTAFCCSGHTNQKRYTVWSYKASDFVEGSEAYIFFKDVYDIPGQQIVHGHSRLSAISCGTLMGIKKACKKLYRTAQKLPAIKETLE